MANSSLPYPDNLQWCLSVFNRGWGLPTSYIDILPNGQTYWATKTYLEQGAFDEYGRKTDLDSIIAIQERTLSPSYFFILWSFEVPRSPCYLTLFS